jgi:hypothetical protein
MARKASPRKLGITRRRDIDTQTIGVNLFTTDRRLVDDEVGKSGTTKSEVLRHIVHQWGIKKRLAPDVADTAQEPSLLALQKKALAELNETKRELQAVLRQLKETGQMQADSLALNETEFKRVIALGAAHYNLSAQSFSAVWAALYFLQHFIVEPTLAKDQQYQKNHKQIAAQAREDSRSEAMNLLEQMAETFQSPVPIEMVLIRPPSSE